MAKMPAMEEERPMGDKAAVDEDTPVDGKVPGDERPVRKVPAAHAACKEPAATTATHGHTTMHAHGMAIADQNEGAIAVLARQ